MADQCFRFEIAGLNANQAQTAMDFILALPEASGVNIGMEYTPNAGNPELAQNTLRVSLTGPDLTALKTALRNEVNSRLGRFPDIEVTKTSDLTAIVAAYQTHGASLANRAALQAALRDIWKNGARCMSGADKRQLDTWLINRGFFFTKNGKKWADYKALRQWLKERP